MLLLSTALKRLKGDEMVFHLYVQTPIKSILLLLLFAIVVVVVVVDLLLLILGRHFNFQNLWIVALLK